MRDGSSWVFIKNRDGVPISSLAVGRGNKRKYVYYTQSVVGRKFVILADSCPTAIVEVDFM